MTDTTHDPPADLPVSIPPGAAPPVGAHVTISPEGLAALRGPGFEKYELMRAKLGVDPIRTIAHMRSGGYRYKSRRGYPGVLVQDRAGEPVPDLMSFRQIAPVLSELTGVMVTYETIRRWWAAAFPEEPMDGPEPESVPPTAPVRRVTRRRTPAASAVGDEHAETIRAAMERANTSTNPAVPPAAFVPPAA